MRTPETHREPESRLGSPPERETAADSEYEQVLDNWLDMRNSRPQMEGELTDDEVWVSRAVTAYLAGFRPIPGWAVEVLEDLEAHAESSNLPTAPQREFLDRLLALVRKVKTADCADDLLRQSDQAATHVPAERYALLRPLERSRKATASARVGHPVEDGPG